MSYIIRIKAVSECMRIRRAAVMYLLDKNQTVSLSDVPHPIKKFKELSYIDGFMSIGDDKEYLKVGEESFFYRITEVDTGYGLENERIALGAMLFPLDDGIVSQLIKEVEDNKSFDQWNGEYEYIIGLYYEYVKKDDELASIWYQKAIDKNFKFEIKE